MKRPLPHSPAQWLQEIRLSIADARETIPFGRMIGHRMTEADLFHLAPVICLKFRGLKVTGKEAKRVTEVALANYVANSNPAGINHGLEQRPVMTFMLCYVAAHLALDLLDEAKAEAILSYCEEHLEKSENLQSDESMAARQQSTLDSKISLDDVPHDYRERFMEIVALADDFCDHFLNDEYKQISRKMAACLCQDGSPVLKGKPASWACGLVYTVGRVNFLTDPSQKPHLKAEQIAQGFGVSPATMHAKSSEIWKGLDLMPLDPDFTIASRVDQNPLIWMLSINGVLMDIRDAPREAQVVAFEQGLIPYIPADRANE